MDSPILPTAEALGSVPGKDPVRPQLAQPERSRAESAPLDLPERNALLRRDRLARMARWIDLPSRWALVAVGLWEYWHTRSYGWASTWSWIMTGYLLVAIVSTGVWATRPARLRQSRWASWLVYLSFGADTLFVCALIWRDGGLGSPLFVLLGLLALKAAALAPALPGMIWVPFGFGPLYVLALRSASGTLAFLLDPSFLGRYLLIWIWLLGIVLLAWELERRTARADALEDALRQQQAALAQKTEVLQRTATDLGDRVLELRSLQEVAKSLATTLRLEETLQLVVERLRGVTGSSHCAVALVDAEDSAAPWGSGYLVGTRAADIFGTSWQPESSGTERVEAGGNAAGDAIQEPSLSQWYNANAFRVPLTAEPETVQALVSDRVIHAGGCASVDTPLCRLLGGGAYIVAPLISRGRPIGALYLAERDRGALDTKTEQLVNSFAYFAATAIENARLYQDAWEKRRELEAVLAGIGDGVLVVDPELHLLLMNPVARDILELEEAPPAGVPLKPYLSSPSFADLLGETLRSQQEQIRELDLGGPTREGTVRTYGALASPVMNANGQVRGVVAVLRDITVQKELERMKSNFLSVVSHELRTPLHSIKGFVEIILMGKTGPVTDLQEDFLRTVRGQTTVLQHMIDDLLEFSRMEAGRVKLSLAEVALPALARTVATKLAPLAEEASLELFLDIPDDLPEIDGDHIRLEQVLTNLVENAIKFTPAGGRVWITAARLDDRVRLTVADTGIGIAPEEQEKIFDRFYQVDGSERRAYRGTGLGLSICRHIVERHCGRIWVESDGIAGHGSRFLVELPIQLCLGEAPTIDFSTPAR